MSATTSSTRAGRSSCACSSAISSAETAAIRWTDARTARRSSASQFGYLAANVVDEGTRNPILPPYDFVNTRAGKVAFIGETLENTPLIVTPSGSRGSTFSTRRDSANALVPELKRQGAETIVLLLHQGGFQNAPFSRGFQDVNACEHFNGA